MSLQNIFTHKYNTETYIYAYIHIAVIYMHTYSYTYNILNSTLILYIRPPLFETKNQGDAYFVSPRYHNDIRKHTVSCDLTQKNGAKIRAKPYRHTASVNLTPKKRAYIP